MELTSIIPAGSRLIDGYSPGFFSINGERFAGPLLLTPGRTVPLLLDGYEDLTLTSWAGILDQISETEVLLVGQGGVFAGLLPYTMRELARTRGLLVEVMDSRAACRTWNVLHAEGRRVAALLWPIQGVSTESGLGHIPC